MSRWLSETGGTEGASYAARFAALAASGVDVHGEAAYVDALLEPGSRVLDAGCGTGRVAVELARRGHVVTGVDNDASMLAQASGTDVSWLLEDLVALTVTGFDLVVAAGNVMVFLEPGTEASVVARLAGALVPGGLLVSGWRTDRLAAAVYDGWAAAAGLLPVVRHATWQGAPLEPDSPWCVAVDRRQDLAPALA